MTLDPTPTKTYAGHSGVWLAFDDLRRTSRIATVYGGCPITAPDELAEGAILRTLDGSWYEVFIVDTLNELYFCEPVAA